VWSDLTGAPSPDRAATRAWPARARIRFLAGRLALARLFRKRRKVGVRGDSVKDTAIEPGTPIATFLNLDGSLPIGTLAAPLTRREQTVTMLRFCWPRQRTAFGSRNSSPAQAARMLISILGRIRKAARSRQRTTLPSMTRTAGRPERTTHIGTHSRHCRRRPR
jgi:hypothetical protein